MPGLVPGIHVFRSAKTWMAGTSPAMTPHSTIAPTDIAGIAAEALAALDSGGQIAPFSSRLAAFEIEDAYRVTAAVRKMREARGERVVGRKIGFTNRTIWTEYGVHAPIWGYVYDRTVHDLAGPGGTFSLAGLAEPRIEPEIVFGIAQSPAPGMDERTLLDCIGWVAHGFRNRAVDLSRMEVLCRRHGRGLRPARGAIDRASSYA